MTDTEKILWQQLLDTVESRKMDLHIHMDEPTRSDFVRVRLDFAITLRADGSDLGPLAGRLLSDLKAYDKGRR